MFRRSRQILPREPVDVACPGPVVRVVTAANRQRPVISGNAGETMRAVKFRGRLDDRAVSLTRRRSPSYNSAVVFRSALLPLLLAVCYTLAIAAEVGLVPTPTPPCACEAAGRVCRCDTGGCCGAKRDEAAAPKSCCDRVAKPSKRDCCGRKPKRSPLPAVASRCGCTDHAVSGIPALPVRVVASPVTPPQPVASSYPLPQSEAATRRGRSLDPPVPRSV